MWGFDAFTVKEEAFLVFEREPVDLQTYLSDGKAEVANGQSVLSRQIVTALCRASASRPRHAAWRAPLSHSVSPS